MYGTGSIATINLLLHRTLVRLGILLGIVPVSILAKESSYLLRSQTLYRVSNGCFYRLETNRC